MVATFGMLMPGGIRSSNWPFLLSTTRTTAETMITKGKDKRVFPFDYGGVLYGETCGCFRRASYSNADSSFRDLSSL